MVVEFTVAPSSTLGILPMSILVATGAFIIILAVVTGRRAKAVRGTFYTLLAIGIITIGIGIGLPFLTGSSSTITVGSGYMAINSPSFGGSGSLNVTSGMVQSAYVGHIGSGNLSISKIHGTNYGDTNIGVYSMSTGDTAYVVSNNLTSLVLHLTDGKYVIVGTSDTNALVTAFSKSVYPVQA